MRQQLCRWSLLRHRLRRGLPVLRRRGQQGHLHHAAVGQAPQAWRRLRQLQLDPCGGECKGKPNDCSFPAQGTECAPAKCASADVTEPARTCDGSGKCEGSKKENCAPFVCDSALGGCKTKRASSKDCATGAGAV